MTVPLWTLGILSVGLTAIFTLGLFIPFFNFEHHFVEWLEPLLLPEDILEFDWVVGLSSITIALLGIGLAYLIYYPRGNAQVSFAKDDPSFMFEVSKVDGITSIQSSARSVVRGVKGSPIGRGVQRLLEKGYYIDDLYLGLVHVIYEYYCEAMNWIEKNVFDRAVRFTGWVGYTICGISKWTDDNIVDRAVRLTAQAGLAIGTVAKETDERVIDHGIIRGSARGVMKTGGYLRRIQTGVVENYALYSLLGAIILVITAIIVTGAFPLY
jgi:NADH:ubiquinone oxidoreductase subunit 5 (subunit L)/multisubunit Na+/H+ antiporter MnhA subunit